MNEENRMQEIMNRIKNRRIELSLSYQELADKTGLSKSTLQRYETGAIKNMPLDKLEVLSKALDIDPSYLMGWEAESNNKELSDDEITLLANYNKLNDLGKTEANKRVAELSYMPMYCDNKISTTRDKVVDITPKKELTYDDFETVAAHNDDLTADEIAEADRRILEDLNKRQ